MGMVIIVVHTFIVNLKYCVYGLISDTSDTAKNNNTLRDRAWKSESELIFRGCSLGNK